MRILAFLAVCFSHFSAFAADATPVELRTDDGVAIRADARGAGGHAVLLLHDEGRSSEDWADFSTRLASAGFQVLAVDLRGHGRTGGAPPAEEDWVRMTAEVRAGVAWLRAHGATHVSLVGARLGGSLALQVASADPAIASVGVLSPVLSAHGVKVGGALTALAGRPTLLVTSTQDLTGLRAIDTIRAVAPGVTVLPPVEAGTGVDLLSRAANLETEVITWVRATQATETVEIQRETGASAEMETTGVRFGQP